jgi:hypothetical protein
MFAMPGSVADAERVATPIFSSYTAVMEQLISAACALFGIGMSIWACIDWQHARRSLAWPTVQGQIVKSSVTRYASRRWHWDWQVEYRYRVDGHDYTGWRTYFGSSVPIAVARNIVGKFPLHSTVTVHHHPREPAKSVLLPGVNKYTRLSFLVGPVTWAVALALHTLA